MQSPASWRVVAVVVFGIGVACGGGGPAESSSGAPPVPAVVARADAAVLMEADRAFAADVAAGGSSAWAEWFAADGAIVRPGEGEIRGRDAVRAALAYLDEPGESLHWEPARAEIAAGGDLGWTTGPYVSESTAPDGSVRRVEGVYVSIWRLDDQGRWRVVMDLGNPTGPPPPQ